MIAPPEVVVARVQVYGDTVEQLVAQAREQLDALAGTTYVCDDTRWDQITRTGDRWGATVTGRLLAL